jgi:hypothetical protein
MHGIGWEIPWGWGCGGGGWWRVLRPLYRFLQKAPGHIYKDDVQVLPPPWIFASHYPWKTWFLCWKTIFLRGDRTCDSIISNLTLYLVKRLYNIEYQSFSPVVWIGSPPPCKRVCPPQKNDPGGGKHWLAGEGVRGPNSEDWTETLVLCMYNCIILYALPLHHLLGVTLLIFVKNSHVNIL